LIEKHDVFFNIDSYFSASDIQNEKKFSSKPKSQDEVQER